MPKETPAIILLVFFFSELRVYFSDPLCRHGTEAADTSLLGIEEWVEKDQQDMSKKM